MYVPSHSILPSLVDTDQVLFLSDNADWKGSDSGNDSSDSESDDGSGSGSGSDSEEDDGIAAVETTPIETIELEDLVLTEEDQALAAVNKIEAEVRLDFLVAEEMY